MADLVQQVNKKNKILALDQSSRVSGWSFLENGELKSFGHWSYTADDVAIRINNLCQEVESKIDDDAGHQTAALDDDVAGIVLGGGSGIDHDDAEQRCHDAQRQQEHIALFRDLYDLR